MGCSAAKNVAVAPLDMDEHSSNGVANRERSGIQPKSTSSRSSKDLDIQPGPLSENAVVNNVQKAGNGMSFEITFDENDAANDSIIQKHPPKRILELQESESKAPPVTLEKLQEKLEEAEIRRQQILQQRTQSANVLKRSKNTEMLESLECDDIEDEIRPSQHLRVPPIQRSPSGPANSN